MNQNKKAQNVTTNYTHTYIHKETWQIADIDLVDSLSSFHRQASGQPYLIFLSSALSF